MISQTHTRTQTQPAPAQQLPFTARLRELASQYQQTLLRNPRHAESLAGMSLIALATRQHEAAVHMAQAAVAAAPKMVPAWVILGQALRATGRHIEAETSYATALALDPQDTLALVGLGELKTAAGAPEAALHLFTRALNCNPAMAAAHLGHGSALACLDRFEEALVSYEQALTLKPRLAEAEFAIGFVLTRLGHREEAERRYRRAIKLRPDFAAAWMNLGCLMREMGRELYAEAALVRSVELRPDLIAAWIDLALVKRETGRVEEAKKHLEKALALDPNRAETAVAWLQFSVFRKDTEAAWQWHARAESLDPQNAEAANMKGILLHNAGRFEEAVAAFLRAEELGSRQAPSNCGNSLLELGHIEEALIAHARAHQLDPVNPGTRYNMALTQLRTGRWREGWPNYESRWSFREVHKKPRRLGHPRWTGEPLGGKRILLHAEQGLGDTIQFCRYAELVAARGGFPILQVQPGVARLIRSLNLVQEGRAEVAELNIGMQTPATPPAFDLECPLLSLPAVFETTIETVPQLGQYLFADPADIEARPVRFPDGDCGYPRIGIAWAGNPRYKSDRQRSTHLETFKPLLEIPGIDWVSLQKGEAAEQLLGLHPAIRIIDAAHSDRDLADTAATISALDLVITTDTSIAHLAGAMAKPVWILLPHLADWRWMQEIETTPWYPTARLIRQTAPGDWPGVIRQIKAALPR